MAKSNFGKVFLIAAAIGGGAGIIAGLGDRAEAKAATPPPVPPKKKGTRAEAGASAYASPLAYLYGVWPLIKSGIAGQKSLQQAATVSRALVNNDDFLANASKEEVNFIITLHAELAKRLGA